MGYRSEVAIKCEEKAYEMLRETCNQVRLIPDAIYKDEEYFIFYWDWIKWYDTYYEIIAIENTMSKLDDLGNEPGYGYRFMRLGEDDTDVETRQNNYDIELWMIRKIDIPEGLEEINY